MRKLFLSKIFLGFCDSVVPCTGLIKWKSSVFEVSGNLISILVRTFALKRLFAWITILVELSLQLHVGNLSTSMLDCVAHVWGSLSAEKRQVSLGVLRKSGGSSHSFGMSDGMTAWEPWPAGIVFPGRCLQWSVFEFSWTWPNLLTMYLFCLWLGWIHPNVSLC